jgi:hypothetical protein
MTHRQGPALSNSDVEERGNEIRETVVGSKTHAAKLPEHVIQLLRESVETIQQFKNQNDNTRSFVARAQEVLDTQDNQPTKET